LTIRLYNIIGKLEGKKGKAVV